LNSKINLSLEYINILLQKYNRIIYILKYNKKIFKIVLYKYYLKNVKDIYIRT